jgi:hypothetical protein
LKRSSGSPVECNRNPARNVPGRHQCILGEEHFAMQSAGGSSAIHP